MKKDLLRLCILLVTICFVGSSCSDEEITPGGGEENGIPENVNGLIHLKTLEDYTKDNHIYMLENGESNDIIFSSARSFDPRHPVQVSITEDQKLLLRAFSPRKITNMKIWATIDGYYDKFLLAQFDIIPPFLEFFQTLPFVHADKEYQTSEGKTIRIMANPHISADNLSFEIECDDAYYQMFSKIKTTWKVSFSRFNWEENDKWKYFMKAGHCREAIAMSINSAYMFSSPEYEEEMRKYNGQFYSNGSGHGPEGKNGPVIPDNQLLIQQSLTRPSYAWGHVNQVGGLGGGGTLGLTDDSFVSHYADDTGGAMAWFHEFGHGMGYGDSNNTVISNDGGNTPSWRKVCQELYKRMCVEKKLPIYSRRFMHSRRNYDFYSPAHNANWRFQSSAVIIEGPELDEIDGGLSAGEGFLATDTKGNQGNALSFKLNYIQAETEKNNYAPRDIYIYGDILYVINDMRAKDYSFDVFDVSNGIPVHIKRIISWTHPTTNEEIKLGKPMGVIRSYDKIYLTGFNNTVYVFDANTYKCISVLTPNGGAYALAASKGSIFTFRDAVRAFPEHLIPPTNIGVVPVIATSPNLNSHSDNSLTVDANENVYSLSYYTKKMVKLDTQYLMAGKINTTNELTLEKNPMGAAFSKDGRLFVSFAGTDQKFCEIDPATGKIIKDYTTIGNVTLKNPTKCLIRRNTLIIVDRNPEWCVYAIPMNELN